MSTLLAFVPILLGGLALAQGTPPTDRKARVVAAMKRIEHDVKSVKVFSGLRHPPLYTSSLDGEIKKFHQEFPEYSDDLELYVSMALPWYRLPARE